MRSICLSESYKAREVHFLKLWDAQGWRVKIYGVAHHSRTMPDERTVQRVGAIALNRLSRVDPSQHYGVAFVVIHMAREADFVLIDWWTGENVLQQALFTCPADKPTELREITSTGLLGCVWELQVHNFERLAWIECVLNNAVGPDLDGYLNRRFNGLV